MFSAVQFELAGKRVLDAFAGSGQLGIEALSRGAAPCVFCERDPKAAAIVAENLQKCRMTDKAKIIKGDTMTYLRTARETFGLILLDPPYAAELLPEAIHFSAALLAEDGILLCEAPVRLSLPEAAGHALLQKVYPHGKTKILLYRVMNESV